MPVNKYADDYSLLETLIKNIVVIDTQTFCNLKIDTLFKSIFDNSKDLKFLIIWDILKEYSYQSGDVNFFSIIPI